MIQLIRGFKDILPGEVERWQTVEKTAVAVFENFGFKEIRIPIMERTELFARSIGEATDIVEKEMYTLADRKGDKITLRPEATASVVRAYVQHKLYAPDPVKKYYTIGPMFRRERPQRGRYRQFYQINAEIFGVASPRMDAQLIYMLEMFLTRLSVVDRCVRINSLGCPACRPGYKEALLTHTANVVDQLCADCKRRREQNPLRVLDCKVPSCREAVVGAPLLQDHLCSDCIQHFGVVRDSLEELEVAYEIDQRLVRGLDYYSRTIFEIQTSALGAQSAIAGGGRYDGLIQALGGPKMPAVGFAIGLDRLVELIQFNETKQHGSVDLFVAALGEKSQRIALTWASKLSNEGVRTELDLSGKSLKSLMKRANRMGAARVMIAGDAELAQEAVIVRNMATKEQVSVPFGNLIADIKQRVVDGA
ncbi:MAG: histidine--tRNA ligase [Deltaproteobacteria bacterium]|nr:histidine--tRNA ligase [Deltaproteobacteria bacterium]